MLVLLHEPPICSIRLRRGLLHGQSIGASATVKVGPLNISLQERIQSSLRRHRVNLFVFVLFK
jgi:hypothetical protein